jgi:hypothetical protein
MNVIHMNEGHKVTAMMAACVLTLGGALSIDIAAAQRDTETVITVFADAAGKLSYEGETYAAVVIIPPRRCVDEEVTETVDGEEVTQTLSVPQPCQASAVTLQLWAVPEATEPTETEE